MNQQQRPVQYFSDGYLQMCKTLTPEQIIQFIEEFRTLIAASNQDAVTTRERR